MEESVKKNFRNVLIIDDDDDDCSLIAETLQEIDNQVKCVLKPDGRSGLTYIIDTDLKPDIIFLDLHMPKMNGLELLKILKADPGLSHIPVVICTDSKLVSEIEECKKLGASEVIKKPASFLLTKYEVRKALKAISNTLVS
jgi:CheY-like chemotaxis protein